MKRSSCDSGSGETPTWSSGFASRMTKTVAAVPRFTVDGDLPLLHRLQQRTLCFEGARLSSSASSNCAKIGPG